MQSTCTKLAFAVAALAASTSMAHAEWPKDRPIQMIVAFAPGGSTDVMARAIEPLLEKELGADIVIENRPGASGEIAYTALSKAKPDGYTFSYINTPGYLSMQVQRKLGYDPKTIKPIAIKRISMSNRNTGKMLIPASMAALVNTIAKRIT